MSRDIKEHISRCETCTTFPTRQSIEPLTSHKVPNRPWAKIGSDLFQFQNKDYLVTVDYLSNFFEIDYLSTTTSSTVVKKLKGHMAWYGIPDEVVSGHNTIQKNFKRLPNPLRSSILALAHTTRVGGEAS